MTQNIATGRMSRILMISVNIDFLRVFLNVFGHSSAFVGRVFRLVLRLLQNYVAVRLQVCRVVRTGSLWKLVRPRMLVVEIA